jgi:DNA mismatch repair protein MutL
MIEARRYPLAVLLIHLPPEDVDVNVHPAKMEVRFRYPRDIYEVVLSALVGTLARSSDRLEKKNADGTAGFAEGILSVHGGRVEEAMRRYASYDPASREAVVKGIFAVAPPEEGQRDREGESGFFGSLQYLGQLDRTYLIFTHPRGIVILDQHAAHERILLEKLRRGIKEGNIAGQSYLIPDIVNLPPGALALLEDARGLLEEMGLHAEPFGGDAVRITSFPECLSHLDPGGVIRDILEELSEMGRFPDVVAWKEKIMIVMACKGAVKAREGLARGEIDSLCRDLDAIPFATTCPHGRPISIRFDLKDMEKLFKRS